MSELAVNLIQNNDESIREPITILDAMILDAINKYGNKNVPTPDPRTGEYPGRFFSARSRTIGADDSEILFGSDYLTTKLPVSNGEVVCYYQRSGGSAGIVVDRFKPRGGMASRTTFMSYSPAIILKTHKTNFRVDNAHPFGINDFSRQLKKHEVVTVLEMLSFDDLREDAVATLTSISPYEQKLKTIEQQRLKNFDEVRRAYSEGIWRARMGLSNTKENEEIIRRHKKSKNL